MRVLAMAAAAVLALAVAGEPEANRLRVELRLKDGSIIVGELVSPREVKLDRDRDQKTFRADELLQVAPGEVKDTDRGRRPGGVETRDVVVGKAGRFEGKLVPPGPWVVDTGFGTLTVPHAEVRIAGFYGVVFDCNLRENASRGMSQVGKSGWEITPACAKVSPLESGNALLMPIPITGDYVIEADVRCDGWAALLFNARPAQSLPGGWDISALWFTPGTAGFYATPDWKNAPIRTWKVETREGQTLHVRLAVTGRHAAFSIDGQEIGEADVPSDGRMYGFGAWTKDAKFENVRFSR